MENVPIYKELYKDLLSLSNVTSKSWEKCEENWEKMELEISVIVLGENRNYSEEVTVIEIVKEDYVSVSLQMM